MISYLNGYVIDRPAGRVTILCGGVGYDVKISLRCYAALPDSEGEIVGLYVKTVVREDAIELFGFSERREMEMFGLLTSINGIGGATAINILGRIGPDELAAAIRAKDVDTLKAVKGVGPKTAERLVLELKNKVATDMEATISMPAQVFKYQQERADALTALLELGLKKQVVEGKIDAAISRMEANGKAVTTQDLVREGLKP